jgi:alpha-L-arabinofuranosidase
MTHLFQRKKLAMLAAAGILASASAFAQATVKVDVNKPGHAVPSTLWGIFFEDINLSADGGLYPELVRNRSFEDAALPDHWSFSKPEGSRSAMAIDSSSPLNALNRQCLKVTVDGSFILENGGYWGMNVVKGNSYTFSVAARAADGFSGPLNVKLLSSTGDELATGEIRVLSRNWQYHSLELTATGDEPKAKLQISASSGGTVFLDMVSLMPKKTFKEHGLRVDLAEALNALHPSFMRFPGGNWVEGDDLAHMYHWKSTIGPNDARTPLWNTWGYNTTQGLGFLEYLQLCEDLGAEPVFCINDGMSLHDSVPLGQMGQWIQDALDAIDYASGPTNTVWGGLRAAQGHPAPFPLHYMEIGNENGGPDYLQRWPLLVNAIRAKHPEIQLIVNTDLQGRPYPRNPRPDIVDEHYYESPESFMRRAEQYDTYNREGPKIFVGEYAVTRNAGQGNLRAAIGEAAFMTGMERNSDVVVMASYAPLFVNVNHRAWNPDLISFDSSRWYGSPSYYVQQMFSENLGDTTLPITVDSGDVVEPPATGCVGVGTWNTAAEFKDLKVTAADGTVLYASDFGRGSEGWKFLGEGDWKVLDGVLRQNVEKENVRALVGDRSWTNYTFDVKARKLSGREGFLILFHTKADEERSWWNLGGWANTKDAIELEDTLDSKPGYIETGRWYNIRVKVQGSAIRCWLDGKLVHEILKPRQATHRLYASATRDSKTGDVIMKVVNTASGPVNTEIKLQGAPRLSGLGQSIVLTSEDPWEENSLEQPTKVFPSRGTFDFQSGVLRRSFPGNSVTVLRFRLRTEETKS